jgi:hypothetical protein
MYKFKEYLELIIWIIFGTLFIGSVIWFQILPANAAEPTCEQKLAACDKCVTGCEAAVKELSEQVAIASLAKEVVLEDNAKLMKTNATLIEEIKDTKEAAPSRLLWFSAGIGVGALLFGIGAFIYLIVA